MPCERKVPQDLLRPKVNLDSRTQLGANYCAEDFQRPFSPVTLGFKGGLCYVGEAKA